ncbi:hypothetical protein QFC21_002145 [Naganishia friedmannii]|uniref:Uncharacterized protein n=1 Tax=Naganishia friedmannii TaxID=89922 RepID=A0ACC2VZ83_9TREE|nr:hypothetical protein QFC21_002145 [Naganishia friedmannii]
MVPQTTNATPVPSNDSSSSSDPILSLPYATYKGYHNTTSHIYQFRSVRFAASTANANRWRAAQPPADERGLDVQDASGWPKQCPQATAGGVVSKDAYNPLQGLDDEDCLFLSVWAPDGVVLNAGKVKESGEKEGKKTKEMDLLPVLVWIHGGGWDHNSVREFDHTPLLTSTNNSFIGISIQYRLGAFGFLADPAMAADGGLNAGITDARAALRWVQEYVHLLGGDRKRVTIWGQSSGGGTVGQLLAAEAEADGMQMGANEKEKGKEGNEVLFQGAMLSSPYMVPMGNCNDSFWKLIVGVMRMVQDQFEDFSRRAGCTNDLECLRRQDTSLLRTLNHEHYVNYTYSGRPSVYEPCIEGPGGYIQYNTVERILSGQVAGHAVIAGSNYADGSTFVTSASLQVPKNITHPAQVATQADTLLASVLMQKWPLTKDQAREAVSLYPLAAFKDNYERGGVVFTDAVFACASNWIADAYGNNGYRYLYAVADAVHARAFTNLTSGA